MSYRNRRPRTFNQPGGGRLDPEDWEKVSRAKANLDELERLVPDALGRARRSCSCPADGKLPLTGTGRTPR